MIFEYPLKENYRTFLRLELLFNQFERNRLASNEDNHLHALKILLEVLEILERGDSRSEITKELSRLSDYFTKLRQLPDVDVTKLENFLTQINQLKSWVFNYHGKFGDSLRKTPFIENIKHRMSIPGGTCSFDCPDLHLFLNKTHQERQGNFSHWLDNIKGIKTSIEVILRITRETGHWQDCVAPMGSYLIEPGNESLNLLRVKITQEKAIFPEFSCGKHRSNIHFMYFNSEHKKIATQSKVAFDLACCH
jgi:cell division protein ZapD